MSKLAKKKHKKKQEPEAAASSTHKNKKKTGKLGEKGQGADNGQTETGEGSEAEEEEKPKKSTAAMIKDIVVIFLLAFALSMAIKGLVIDNRLIPTSSMVPTVPVNGRILVNRLVYDFGGEPKFQDIVVFEPTEMTKSELGRGDDMLKRVMGLAGDEIMVSGGVLYRNSLPVDEPYLAETMDYEFGPVTVPEGYVLLLGDNRNASFDAHLWTEPFVPVGNVKGKAFVLYWPLSEFKLLN